jgi:signal transduction histidine kinase
VRADLASLRADPAARLDPDAHPREVAPLAAAINALADARARDMEAARHRARDLAHALKTPLAALRLQIEDLPQLERADAAQALAVLNDAVHAELARAGAARAAAGTCLLAPLIGRLLPVMRPGSEAAGCAVSVSAPDGFAVPMEETVAMEVFGALLDNALRHARTRVSVVAGADAGARWVLIEDDGPGLAPQQRAAALIRGVRLDEAGGTAGLAAGSGGQGLGLSIAKAYVEASGGRLDLDAAAPGGLMVRLLWPAHLAAEGA